jgi:hypothetical protein
MWNVKTPTLTERLAINPSLSTPAAVVLICHDDIHCRECLQRAAGRRFIVSAS